MKVKDFWDKFNLDGAITIASRTRRFSDLLFAQVQELYDLRERSFKTSWFATLATLRQEGKIDFKTLASRNNISSAAVSQLVKELEELGLVKLVPGQDKRSRWISLTEKGEKKIDSVIPDLLDVRNVVAEIFGDFEQPMIKALEEVTKQLKTKSVVQRALGIEIVPFESKYKKDFEKLNRAWLDGMFILDEYDKELFANPKKMIIDQGGEIFFALHGDEVVGTLALIHRDKTKLEMSKMTVREDFRRQGIAKLLLNAAVGFAKKNNYKELLALTNSKLKAAGKFYKKNKFIGSKARDERYERCDKEYLLTLN